MEPRPELRIAEFFVRCPSCTKLYVVPQSSTRTLEPHFECQICSCLFQTVGEIQSGQTVPTRIVEPEIKTSEKVCPRCSQTNRADDRECRSCGIVFAKWYHNPDQSQNPSSLDISWSKVLNHFDDLKIHEDFLKVCQSLEDLPYASRRYKELNSILGGDLVCQSMLQKILGLEISKSEAQTRELEEIPWSRYIYWGVLLLAAFFIVLGVFVPSLSNLMGIGIAILVLCIGLTVVLRKPSLGRSIGWREFLGF